MVLEPVPGGVSQEVHAVVPVVVRTTVIGLSVTSLDRCQDLLRLLRRNRFGKEVDVLTATAVVVAVDVFLDLDEGESELLASTNHPIPVGSRIDAGEVLDFRLATSRENFANRGEYLLLVPGDILLQRGDLVGEEPALTGHRENGDASAVVERHQLRWDEDVLGAVDESVLLSDTSFDGGFDPTDASPFRHDLVQVPVRLFGDELPDVLVGDWSVEPSDVIFVLLDHLGDSFGVQDLGFSFHFCSFPLLMIRVTTLIINTSVDFNDRIPLFVTSKQGEFMINNLNRSELVSRGLGGGAVVVASGSEIRVKEFVENNVTYPVYIRSWFRLYSDGWLEQGSSKPFAEFTNDTPSAAEGEKYETIDLVIPYDDTSFEIQMTMWDIIPNIYNDTQVQAASKTYKSFNACQGTMAAASQSAHIRTYGGVNWRTSGYVSQETFKQVLAGKEWDPITESFGGEYLVNIESGSRELTLEPGRYKVYMVGKGGEAYANFTANNGGWWGTSGGAGGTVIAEITLSEATDIKLDIDDSNEQSALYFGSSGSYTKFIAAGYGKKTTSSNVTNTGGTNTVTTDSRITVTSDVNGENSKYGNTYIFAGGDVTVGEVESSYGSSTRTRYGNSGQVRVKADGGITATPGPALIMLYKFGD